MEEELPTRWEIELEFVQSLGNIQYLNYLAQNDYLTNECFLNYLNYLNYWKEPKYSKYLVYPNCLHILTLLQSEEFRRSIVNPDFMNSLMNDMVKRWQSPDDIFSSGSPNTTPNTQQQSQHDQQQQKDQGLATNGIEVRIDDVDPKESDPSSDIKMEKSETHEPEVKLDDKNSFKPPETVKTEESDVQTNNGTAAEDPQSAEGGNPSDAIEIDG